VVRPIATRQTRIAATRRQAFSDTWVRALAFLALAIGLSVTHGSSAQLGPVEIGHNLVLRDCGMCHAVGQTGASPNPAAPTFRDLHLRYPVNSLARALAEGTIIGHPRMPQFHFSPGEIADIIRYLNSIQTQQPAKIDPARRGSPTAFAASTAQDR
jgi:mono/diheme cytochrome c family protein